MNDMNKRMGDLRGQKGTAGAWARTYFGRSEYGAQQTETEFQAIQVGADHLISAGDAQVWAGAAFSYTKGDSDFSRGTGETNTYALTAYASTLFDCGSFLDASLKYGRLENEFNISFWENQRLKGDFKTNAWSATLEAGHRFEAAQGFFVEPQLEMMYSRIEGDSYGAGLGTKIDQKDVDMLVVRENCEILTLTSRGYGKRSDVEDYRLQGRAGKGIKAGVFNEKTGHLVNLKIVGEDEDIMIISNNGTIIRMHVTDISKIGRNTQGVRVMRLKDSEVATVTVAPREEDEGENAEDLAQDPPEASDDGAASAGEMPEAEQPATDGADGDDGADGE